MGVSSAYDQALNDVVCAQLSIRMCPFRCPFMWASIRAQERALGSRFKVDLSEFWVIIFFEQAEPQSEGSRDTDLGIKLLPGGGS